MMYGPVSGSVGRREASGGALRRGLGEDQVGAVARHLGVEEGFGLGPG